jgi:hypothetical protein
MREILFISDKVNESPCSNCGGEVIDYSIPNDVWNKVVRGQTGGRETENEYLCIWCFVDFVIRMMRGRQ